MADKFFKEQSDLTATKLTFYRKYVKEYMIKQLIVFGECFFGDLFCGPGKNGDKKGSPVILLEESASMINTKVLKLKYKNPKVRVLFNDENVEYIENLKKELSVIKHPKGIEVYDPQNGTFQHIHKEIIEKLPKSADFPKFFFLDPFGYSIVSVSDVKKLLDLKCCEVLLFVPTFHAYRFASSENTVPKTKEFLKDFTIEGVHDYSGGIDQFNESIRQKLLQYSGAKYVRPILLDGGSSKHTLFLLTNHLKGLILANKIVWKLSDNEKGIIVPKISEDNLKLFDDSVIETKTEQKRQLYLIELIEAVLKEKKTMNNVEMIEFVAINGFTSKQSNSALRHLKNNNKVYIKYYNGVTKGYFYVSEACWNKKMRNISLST